MNTMDLHTPAGYGVGQRRSRHPRRLRTGLGLLVAAALVAGGLTVAGHGSAGAPVLASSGAPVSAGAATLVSQPVQAKQVTAAPAVGRSGTPFRGGGYFGNVFRGGRVLTVSSVTGNTIVATFTTTLEREEQATPSTSTIPVTITVTTTTTYTLAGVPATLNDVHTGSTIAVRGMRTGTNTLTATSIAIVLPRTVVGVVTANSGSTITITSFNNRSFTVDVNGQTRYAMAGTTASLSNVTVGTAITAAGTLNSDGSLNAAVVTINVQSLLGTVSSVSGSSIAVTGRNGAAFTITTTTSTVIVGTKGQAVALGSITKGELLLVQGTLSSDGKTMAALRIVVYPMSPGSPGMPFRGHSGRVSIGTARPFPGPFSGVGQGQPAPAAAGASV